MFATHPISWQAVQQMEKNLNELSVEVEMLRDGVEARDEALSFMREEVDRSIDLLSNAAENREVLGFSLLHPIPLLLLSAYVN